VSDERQYSDAVLDSMQLAYGKGFLSPGGAQETRDLLSGLDVQASRCLDFGSGVGGAALLLVSEMHAKQVVGVDVEAAAIARANATVSNAGLADRISFELIEPEGDLPLANTDFDIALTKDVICHVKDKRKLFGEIWRVLEPGGSFNIADWILGTSEAGRRPFGLWLEQLSSYGLRFYYETLDDYGQALRDAGFVDVQPTDHTDWSTENTRAQLERALGAARETSTAALGDAGYQQRTRLTRARLAALETRGVEHWLIRATRPSGSGENQ
jgi:phosphoethanolamine N-methyltransferase